MNKIIVYRDKNFQGLSKEFTSNVPNLINVKFNDCISSLKVIGKPWVVYEDANFKGAPSVYEEGEYATVNSNDKFSSLELVTEDLSNPQITLYEHANYKGRSLVLNCETNLCLGNFNDKVSSHKVQRGAWALYEHPDKGGRMWVARAGRDVPVYTWTNDILSHLRPLGAGRPTIKAEIEWEKKKENVKMVIIDSITGVNHGSEKQTFTTDLHREYSGSITESFNFSNSTQIGVGTKFEVKVFDVGLENTFPVEKGSSNTRTTTESIKVSLPVVIPPRTKLTINVVREEMSITVPVKLTITAGDKSKVEYGEYRREQGSSFSTEYIEEEI